LQIIEITLNIAIESCPFVPDHNSNGRKKKQESIIGSNAPKDNLESSNSDHAHSFLNEKITRRQALSTAAKVGIGAGVAVVVAGSAGYLLGGGLKSSPSSSTTTTASGHVATEKPGANFLIGNITIALALEVSTIFDNGAKQAASALGLSYTTIDTGAGTGAAPIAAARELISQGAKGILSFAIDPSTISQIATLCQQSQVFYSNWWTPQPYIYPWNTGDYYLKFGFQDCEVDELVVDTLLFQKMKDNNLSSGNVINIQGTANLPSNAIKNMGIAEAWKNSGTNVNLVGHPYGAWDLATAEMDTESQIASNPNLNGITTVNDSMSAGAVTGAANDGLNIGPYATGVDGQTAFMQMLSQGNALATATFNPAYIYGLGVCELYDAITGQYYPTQNERLMCTDDLLVVGSVSEAQKLASEANFTIPFPIVSGSDYYSKVYPNGASSTFPWNWKVMSRGKAKELGLTYDVTGGTGWGGQHSYVDALGSADTFSAYVYDAVNRFANFAANTVADLNSAPYAPTAATPNVSTYSWYSKQSSSSTST
jgi:ABC-type sugar transport system substrate-binding protein